jgi:hypothetical protein
VFHTFSAKSSHVEYLVGINSFLPSTFIEYLICIESLVVNLLVERQLARIPTVVGLKVLAVGSLYSSPTFKAITISFVMSSGLCHCAAEDGSMCKRLLQTKLSHQKE